jgi:hypothetical protein
VGGEKKFLSGTQIEENCDWKEESKRERERERDKRGEERKDRKEIK